MKKVFLEILQNLEENTCARVFFNEVAGLRHLEIVNGLLTIFAIKLHHRYLIGS